MAELADMPTAHNHGSIKPIAAAGIATTLYSVAQARFWRITRMVRLAAAAVSANADN